jgi:hypothetical protein
MFAAIKSVVQIYEGLTSYLYFQEGSPVTMKELFPLGCGENVFVVRS